MIRKLLAVAVALTIAGCSSSPTPHFYTLGPRASGAQASAPASPAGPPRIHVGPVVLPDAVNRPQLVTRSGANEVAIAEQHRWAGSLKDEVPRTLAIDLSRLTGNTQIAADPLAAGVAADYRVTVDFQRFDGVLGGDVVLEALWMVLASNGDVVAAGRSAVHESAGPAGYDALVAAYGRALSKLSDSIAPALKDLPDVKR